MTPIPVFEFGLPRRRGLENVRDEMTEKITAYNFRDPNLCDFLVAQFFYFLFGW